VSFLGKLTVAKLIKKYPAFWETRRFINVFTHLVVECHPCPVWPTVSYLIRIWPTETPDIPSWKSLLVSLSLDCFKKAISRSCVTFCLLRREAVIPTSDYKTEDCILSAVRRRCLFSTSEEATLHIFGNSLSSEMWGRACRDHKR
jgi:hypothetical protein